MAQRPANCGLRFSTNAVMPSRASALPAARSQALCLVFQLRLERLPQRARQQAGGSRRRRASGPAPGLAPPARPRPAAQHRRPHDRPARCAARYPRPSSRQAAGSGARGRCPCVRPGRSWRRHRSYSRSANRPLRSARTSRCKPDRCWRSGRRPRPCRSHARWPPAAHRAVPERATPICRSAVHSRILSGSVSRFFENMPMSPPTLKKRPRALSRTARTSRRPASSFATMAHIAAEAGIEGIALFGLVQRRGAPVHPARRVQWSGTPRALPATACAGGVRPPACCRNVCPRRWLQMPTVVALPNCDARLMLPVRPARGRVLLGGDSPLFAGGEFQVPALQRRLDDRLMPQRRNQRREEADEHAGHHDRLAVRHQLVIDLVRIEMMIGVVGDLESHGAGKPVQMVPHMAAADRRTRQTDQAVMLEVVEGFHPGAGHQHSGQAAGHGSPAADHEQDARGKSPAPGPRGRRGGECSRDSGPSCAARRLPCSARRRCSR